MSDIKTAPDELSDGLNLAREKTGWLNRFNERFSELCSSILVKETRQALKSKQFIWTYFLLILCVGFWTVVGISFNSSNSNEYIGSQLLTGFWVILGFPLALIIPFSAYRSLAREYEDGTINLVSITTMKPHQIVVGKLGSAILQMLIYLSVLAPCILSTYLLRGISLEQILLGLGIAVGSSVCLTIMGLFLAGAVRSRALSVGVSVLFALLLGWLYWGWCMIAIEILDSPVFGMQQEFSVITFGFVAFFGSMAALLLVTAASQISFPSDNRSTRIRITMIIQQGLFLAFVVTINQIVPYEDDSFWGMTLFAGHYWLIMGFLMIGETPKMSRRVQRTLPKTIFSRSCFSFLMPGPGRGFLFAVTMMWTCAFSLFLIILFYDYVVIDPDQSSLNRGVTTWKTGLEYTCAGMLVSCFYVTLFLSLVYLLASISLHRTRHELPTGAGPLISLLIGVIIVAFSTIAALVWHFNFVSYRGRSDYSWSQVFNWYWTTIEFAEGSSLNSSMIWFVIFALPASGFILLALIVAARELLQKPIPVPQRVLIDQKKPVTVLPKGESIDEIFGEVPG